MTFGQHNYGDPYDTAHDYVGQVIPAISGPLDGIQGQIAGVLNAADPHRQYLPGPQGSMMVFARPQQPSVIGAAIRGAIYGLIGALLWRRVRGRTAGRHRTR
jgi:hypothetical protein